jgi:hypothetical protein
MDDEVQGIEWRRLAVEFREVHEGTAADGALREGLPGSRIEPIVGGHVLENRPRYDEAEVGTGTDRDGGELRPGAARHASDLLESSFRFVEAGQNELQRQLAAQALRHSLKALQGRAIGEAGIEVAAEKSGLQGVEAVQARDGRVHVLPLQSHADLRHRAVDPADPHGDLFRAAGGARGGGRAFELQLDGLLEGLAGLQDIGVGQPERAHVGLVGGIRPVALILHLEGITQHSAGHREARHDFVLQRADVHDGLFRIDHLGKAGLDLAAADLLHLDPPAADALDAVQHDEAGAVGEEVGFGRSAARKAQAPVRVTGDARPVAEALRVVAADRPIGNAETVFRLLDDEV